MKEFYEENKKLVIALGVIIGVTLLFYIISIFTKEDNKNKYIENKDYVYTLDSQNNSKLPIININTDEIQSINDQLKKEYYEIILYNDSYMKYEYSINDDILSILIEKGIRKTKDDFLEIQYEIYNISISNGYIYTKDEILERYNINKENAENKIENELKKQYNYEADEGYIVYQECNYKCYLYEKEYKSLDNNIELYIKNGKVYGYLNITRASLYYLPDNHPEIKTKFELN